MSRKTERAPRVGHGRNLGRHDDDDALGALDDHERGLRQGRAEVGHDDALTRRDDVKRARGELGVQQIHLFGSQRRRQYTDSRPVVDDRATQVLGEVRLRRG